jgi:hypothetical protein
VAVLYDTGLNSGAPNFKLLRTFLHSRAAESLSRNCIRDGARQTRGTCIAVRLG